MAEIDDFEKMLLSTNLVKAQDLQDLEIKEKMIKLYFKKNKNLLN